LPPKEIQEPNHADELGGASVWWTWTPPVSGSVTVSTAGSDFDTLLAIYTGSVLTNLSLVASSDDVSTNDPTSFVSFNALANRSYQIAVDGFNGAPGDIQLQIVMNGVVWLDTLKRDATGNVALSLTAPTGKLYLFQSSSDLVSWSSFEPLTNANGRVTFIDRSLGNGGRRFYRARQAPQALTD
jgi:hypothetical protein